MTDLGWTRDRVDGGRWVLRDHRGEEKAQVTDKHLKNHDLDVVNEQVARHGWPPLPERPNLVCVLLRGPFDGRWVFLTVTYPPDELMFTPAPGTGGGASLGDRYVLVGQSVRQGPAAPHTYQWDPS